MKVLRLVLSALVLSCGSAADVGTPEKLHLRLRRNKGATQTTKSLDSTNDKQAPPTQHRQHRNQAEGEPTSLNYEVAVEIQYDLAASGIFWSLVDNEDNTIASEQATSKLNGRFKCWNLTLDTGNYIFRIFDGAGDGLCCSNGGGYYRVTGEAHGMSAANKVVIAEGGAFSYLETTHFAIHSNRTVTVASALETASPSASPIAAPALDPGPTGVLNSQSESNGGGGSKKICTILIAVVSAVAILALVSAAEILLAKAHRRRGCLESGPESLDGSTHSIRTVDTEAEDQELVETEEGAGELKPTNKPTAEIGRLPTSQEPLASEEGKDAEDG